MKKKTAVVVFGGVGGKCKKFLSRLDEKDRVIFRELYKKAENIMGWSGEESNENKSEDCSTEVICREWVVTYICDYMLFQKALQQGWQVSMMLGYSLGLNTTLVAAKSISFEDGVKLLLGVSKCVKSAVTGKKRGMGIIVGLCKNDVIQIIKEAKVENQVRIASENASECIVISGYYDEMIKCLEYVKEMGVLKVKDLEVPFSFHYGIYEKCMDYYMEIVENMHIEKAEYSIMSAYDQQLLTSPEQLKSELRRNVYDSMTWNKCVIKLEQMGDKTFLDISTDSFFRKVTKFESDEIEFVGYKKIIPLLRR